MGLSPPASVHALALVVCLACWPSLVDGGEIRVALTTFGEEFPLGDLDAASSDLEMPYDLYNGEQLVGMHFAPLNLPANAVIASAHVLFYNKNSATSQGVVVLRVRAQRSPAPARIEDVVFGLTSRLRTFAFVDWEPADWTTTAGEEQSADLSGLVQEVVGLEGWDETSGLVLFVERSPLDPRAQWNNTRSAITTAGDEPYLVVTYHDPPPSTASGTASSAAFEQASTASFAPSELALATGTTAALLFPSLSIPTSAHLLSAVLELSPSPSTLETLASNLTLWVGIEDNAMPTPLSSSSSVLPSALPLASRTVVWDVASWGAIPDGASGVGWVSSPNLAPLLRSVVNAGEWVSGGGVRLVLSGASGDGVRVALPAATLRVAFIAPSELSATLLSSVVLFDGLTTLQTLTPPPSFLPSQFSISICAQQAPDNRGFVFVNTDPSDPSARCLAWYADGNSNKMLFQYGGSSLTRVATDAGPAIADSRWHALALVYDGKFVTFYLDGEQFAPEEESGGDPATCTGGASTLGNLAGGLASQFFCGRMQSFVAYQYALDPVEVAQLTCESDVPSPGGDDVTVITAQSTQFMQETTTTHAVAPTSNTQLFLPLPLPASSTTPPYLTALRIPSVYLPRNALVTHASLAFQSVPYNTTASLSPLSSPLCLRIWVERAVSPALLSVSSPPMGRVPSVSFVDWDVPEWTADYASSVRHRTPDLSPLLQEIALQEDWQPSSPVVFLLARCPDFDASAASATPDAVASTATRIGAGVVTLTLGFDKRATAPDASAGMARAGEAAQVVGSSTTLQGPPVLPLGQGTVYLRFSNLHLPAPCEVTSAHVQFHTAIPSPFASFLNKTDNTTTVGSVGSNTTLTIRVSRDVSAPSLASLPGTPVPTSQRSVEWVVGQWATVGDASAPQRSPDISALLQDLVSKEEWAAGGSIVVAIEGSGVEVGGGESPEGVTTTVVDGVRYALGMLDNGGPSLVAAYSNAVEAVTLSADAMSQENGDDTSVTVLSTPGGLTLPAPASFPSSPASPHLTALAFPAASLSTSLGIAHASLVVEPSTDESALPPLSLVVDAQATAASALTATNGDLSSRALSTSSAAAWDISDWDPASSPLYSPNVATAVQGALDANAGGDLVVVLRRGESDTGAATRSVADSPKLRVVYRVQPSPSTSPSLTSTPTGSVSVSPSALPSRSASPTASPAPESADEGGRDLWEKYFGSADMYTAIVLGAALIFTCCCVCCIGCRRRRAARRRFKRQRLHDSQPGDIMIPEFPHELDDEDEAPRVVGRKTQVNAHRSPEHGPRDIRFENEGNDKGAGEWL